MMKKFMVYFLIIAMLGVFAVPSFAANLVYNPTFTINESRGGQELPVGWYSCDWDNCPLTDWWGDTDGLTPWNSSMMEYSNNSITLHDHVLGYTTEQWFHSINFSFAPIYNKTANFTIIYTMQDAGAAAPFMFEIQAWNTTSNTATVGSSYGINETGYNSGGGSELMSFSSYKEGIFTRVEVMLNMTKWSVIYPTLKPEDFFSVEVLKNTENEGANITVYEMSVQNMSVPAPPTPITPAPITGTTASIIGFLPLLICVGIIIMVVRKIEDMESTNDLIAVIVGSGIAIVFLGVLSAVIFGVI